MKVCRRCNNLKSPEDFFRDKARKDGRRSICKECERPAYLSRSRKQHSTHREERREYYKTYWIKNKEKHQIQSHTWSKKNKEKKRLSGRRYYYNNRSSENKRTRDRRIRIMRVGGAISIKDWESLKRRYDDSCAYCGVSTDRLTQDHIIPLTRGGSNYIGNIIPACKSCNSSKGTKFIMEWRAFLRITGQLAA